MITALALAAGMMGQGGTLLLAGGGATKPVIVRRFLQAIGGPEEPILVIPLMQQSSDAGQSSAEFLRENGAGRVEVVTEFEFTIGSRRTLAARVFAAKGLWLPGGDQGLFMERLGAEFGRSLFQQAVRRGITVYGTSAGAMLMSDPMIDGWLDDNRPRRSPGLGIAPFLVDTHYRERGRQGRLRFALQNWQAQKQGVGLSEGEWILWRDGQLIETSGRPEWLSQSSSSGSATTSD